jgi:hypothetical protein
VTAVVAAAEPLAPEHAAYWYEPEHVRPAARHLCPCGAIATGRTLYGRGQDWPHPTRTIYHCPDHLPTQPAAYRIEDW